MLSPEQIEKARQVDVLALAERYTTLKKVAATHGGEYAGPCPVCGGHDRFHVQPETNHWFCRHCTGSPDADGWQDVIELQKRISGEDFAQAVQTLTGGQWAITPKRQAAPTASLAPTSEPPGDAWQGRARAIIERSIETLWSQTGKTPILWQKTDPETGEVRPHKASPQDWLFERGLTEATLQAAQIGYIPKYCQDHPTHWGLDGEPVRLHQGILIPTQFNGIVWNLKTRRPNGKPKFIQVRGGRPAFYLAATLLDAPEAACITEGEFDALLLWQCLQTAASPRWRRLGVFTPGSNSNYPNLEQWARYLYPIKHFLLFYDQDGKSQRAIQHWATLSARTRQVTWHNIQPHDKDLTDYHRSGGRLLDLISWAMMQVKYAHQSARQPNPLCVLPDVPEESSPSSPIEHPTPTPTQSRQVVTLPIIEALQHIQANGWQIKSVLWPKGAPRPILELE